MSDPLKPLAEIVGSSFADLERRVQSRMELATEVRAALPGPEKDHVISATYHGGLLVVIADSAAWCSHIRYAQQALLERLNARGEMQFTKLKVKVGRS
jgi:hypothetical protein